jgi:putative transcriptional regulator
MKGMTSLTNQLLIAMPTLADPNFTRTVTFVCEHGAEGAMGIIINRLTDLQLREIFTQLGIEGAPTEHTAAPIYFGGPVQNNRGFVLHQPLGQWGSTLAVTETIGVSTSRDILEAIAANRGPDSYLVAIGYAGWAPGQLEREISENSWLHAPASSELLFHTAPELRWQAAMHLTGADLSNLSGEAGHA